MKEIPPYAIITEPTPAFKRNQEENKWESLRDIFGGPDGKTLKKDEFGQIDELQLVIFAGATIEIIEQCRASVVKIMIEGLDGEYFIDERFLQKEARTFIKPPPKEGKMPPREKILENLRMALGRPYIWGGNKKDGIPKLLDLYPPKGEITQAIRQQWMLAGVDCSGLLYEATEGFTPRNTSGLCSFGKPVKNLEGRSAKEIIPQLQSLDIIVWKGHVMIVLDEIKCIESRLYYSTDAKGKVTDVKPSFVQIRSLNEVLEETLQKRKLVETIGNPPREFTIRRWHEETIKKM